MKKNRGRDNSADSRRDRSRRGSDKPPEPEGPYESVTKIISVKMVVLDPPEPIRSSLRRKHKRNEYTSRFITLTGVVLDPPEPIRPSLRRKKKDR